MPLDPATAAILGTLAGGFFASLTSIVTHRIRTRSEERRLNQEIAFRVASEHYARFCQQIETLQPGYPLPPHMFDTFLVHISQIVDILNRPGRATLGTLAESYANIQNVYDSMRSASRPDGQDQK